MVGQEWATGVAEWPLSEWKHLLACIISYASAEDEFVSLCGELGQRLEVEEDGDYKQDAALCYICGESPDVY